MSIIEAKNIQRILKDDWNATPILKGIDITIEEGEFVAIMGKSGAGKSTLLYQLSALDQPDQGTIVINGIDTASLNKKELTNFRLHTLGYVFQDYALVADMNIFENVLLPLLMRGIDLHTASKMAHDALLAVGLGTTQPRMPAQMSGGEQQRVSIARAIAGKPKILFADEPTANLDSISGKMIIDLLSKLHKEGQTIVMVTHEKEYTTNCNRIVIMEDGKIIGEEHGQPAVTVPTP